MIDLIQAFHGNVSLCKKAKQEQFKPLNNGSLAYHLIQRLCKEAKVTPPKSISVAPISEINSESTFHFDYHYTGALWTHLYLTQGALDKYGVPNFEGMIGHEIGHALMLSGKNPYKLPSKNNEINADYLSGVVTAFPNIESSIQYFVNKGVAAPTDKVHPSDEIRLKALSKEEQQHKEKESDILNTFFNKLEAKSK